MHYISIQKRLTQLHLLYLLHVCECVCVNIYIHIIRFIFIFDLIFISLSYYHFSFLFYWLEVNVGGPDMHFTANGVVCSLTQTEP